MSDSNFPAVPSVARPRDLPAARPPQEDITFVMQRLSLSEGRYERLHLCPDHRDKTGDYCIVCQAEGRTREEIRAEAAWVRPPLDQKAELERWGVDHGQRQDHQLLVRMVDGYWTPWHLAVEAVAAASASRLGADPLDKVEELSHEHRSPDGDGRPQSAGVVSGEAECLPDEAQATNAGRPVGSSRAESKHATAGSEPADAHSTDSRYAGLVAALRELENDIRGWRTAGMGGQTAMALDQWATRLAALVADPPPREQDEDQKNVSR